MAKNKDDFPQWFYPPEARPDLPNGGGVLCYNKADVPKGFTPLQAKPAEENAIDL